MELTLAPPPYPYPSHIDGDIALMYFLVVTTQPVIQEQQVLLQPTGQTLQNDINDQLVEQFQQQDRESINYAAEQVDSFPVRETVTIRKTYRTAKML